MVSYPMRSMAFLLLVAGGCGGASSVSAPAPDAVQAVFVRALAGAIWKRVLSIREPVCVAVQPDPGGPPIDAGGILLDSVQASGSRPYWWSIVPASGCPRTSPTVTLAFPVFRSDSDAVVPVTVTAASEVSHLYCEVWAPARPRVWYDIPGCAELERRVDARPEEKISVGRLALQGLFATLGLPNVNVPICVSIARPGHRELADPDRTILDDPLPAHRVLPLRRCPETYSSVFGGTRPGAPPGHVDPVHAAIGLPLRLSSTRFLIAVSRSTYSTRERVTCEVETRRPAMARCGLLDRVLF